MPYCGNYATYEDRYDEILRSAVSIAEKKGFDKLYKKDVAAQISVAASLVNHYFADVDALKEKVIEYAVKHDLERVLMRAMLARNDLMRKIPKRKREALFEKYKSLM